MIKDDIAKEEIINQAQQLFKQYGLKKTTMDEIAAACGKAKSTMYHYFKNKDEIFDGVIQKELHNIRSIVKENLDQQTTLIEKLTAYFFIFHKETVHKVNLFRILKQELKSEIEKADRYKNVIEFEKSFISGILINGIKTGEFTSIKTEDIPWFSEVMMAAFLGIVRHSIETEGEYDEEKLLKITEALIPRIFT